ncbi:YicC/YloC family endoribonuclease [Melissococcus sp. OM08-11BH]|uniref:YicC/YloC family endoribonuclease n=1 Tax=Melissococcus sp. OM08-11BH TaxID=2293110 RepID=UPI000E52BD80|nr:YicC/YloC family endoribonuclease [Melissococcus sp. OM08-11BH]RGI29729.1 YicC family protein [Melissococcus sp. OM08-11BH]
MKSMTGYGHGECQREDYQIVVEIKSVNHRFLDIQVRLPREYNHLEMEMKKVLKNKLSRGRVECFITLTKESSSSKELMINWPVLDRLVQDLGDAEFHRYKKQPFSAERFLEGGILHPALIEVVEKNDATSDIEVDLLAVFKQALEALNGSRQTEGEGIQSFFYEYVNLINQEISMISKKTETIKQEHYDKLKQKMTSLMEDIPIDESRLLSEVAILIDKGDISEELDRLNVHLNSMAQLLKKEGPVGKELDFLIQEMNREVNTIGSKSTNLDVKSSVIQLKTLIEQIREQVQNIE